MSTKAFTLMPLAGPMKLAGVRIPCTQITTREPEAVVNPRCTLGGIGNLVHSTRHACSHAEINKHKDAGEAADHKLCSWKAAAAFYFEVAETAASIKQKVHKQCLRWPVCRRWLWRC